MIRIPEKSSITHLNIDRWLDIFVREELHLTKLKLITCRIILDNFVECRQYYTIPIQEVKSLLENITGFENNNFILLNVRHQNYGKLFSSLIKNKIEHFKVYGEQNLL